MSSHCSAITTHKTTLKTTLKDSTIMVRQVNLAAAFHDHISCTKLPLPSDRICHIQTDPDIDDVVSVVPSNQSNATHLQPCETDHIYATDNNKGNNLNINDNSNGMGSFRRGQNDFDQIQRLKDMILAQLDLIQHQQEQLLKKDRQLQGLKQDRESLCLRMEKMEKRMAVLSTKAAVSAAVSNASNPGECDISNADDERNETNDETNECTANSGNIIGLFSAPSVFAKLYSQSSNSSSSSTSLTALSCHSTLNSNSLQTVCVKKESHLEDDSDLTPLRKTRKRPANSVNNQINKKRCKSTGTSTASDSAILKNEQFDSLTAKETSNDSVSPVKCNKINSKKVQKKCEKSDVLNNFAAVNNSKSLVNKDVLTTDKCYSINSNCNITSPVSCVKTKSYSRRCPLLGTNIEVPSWRLHPVSSCYSLEGTENLDDEVFQRRHSKLEIDERRRKRWDIQRLREQRHNEKLRTGRYYSGSFGNYFIEKPSDLKRKAPEFSSFYPEPKDVQSIEVTEKLPIIAFGHPIPKLPLKFFSLPWNINCEKTYGKMRNFSASKSRH